MFASLIRILLSILPRVFLPILLFGLVFFPLNLTQPYAVAHTKSHEAIFEQQDDWYLSLRHTTSKSQPAGAPAVMLSVARPSEISSLIDQLSRLSLSSSFSPQIKEQKTLLLKAGGDSFANKTWSFMKSSGLNLRPDTKELVAWLDKERTNRRIKRGGAGSTVLALDLGIETLESIKDGKNLRGAQRENILMHLQTLLTFKIDQASISR